MVSTIVFANAVVILFRIDLVVVSVLVLYGYREQPYIEQGIWYRYTTTGTDCTVVPVPLGKILSRTEHISVNKIILLMILM